MKLRTGVYFVQEAAQSLRRNTWMTFASVGATAVSLFVLGVFLVLALNLAHMAAGLESQVQINVYLADSVTAQQRGEIATQIKNLDGISSVTFVSRDTAKERLAERLGDRKYLLDAIDGKNPLPDAFEVTVSSPELVITAAKTIAEFPGVEEAKYGQDMAVRLFDVARLLRIFGVLLMIMLTGATAFIISNTIRLTVFARRKEIAVMKYVGATDSFIRCPFLLEGISLGLIGGFLAALALRSFYAAMAAKIYNTLAFFPLMPQYPFMDYIGLAVIVAGMLTGVTGSFLSIKRYLKA